MPGDEPARTTATSRSSGPARRGCAAATRAARSRAVPTAGRPWSRRCHSTRYGSNASTRPNSSTARSTSRPKSATPRLKFEAATAAAPRPSEQPVDEVPVGRPAGRRDDDPTAAGVERRGDVRRDRVRPGRIDDDVGRPIERRVVASTGGSAEDADVVGPLAGRIGDGPAEPAVAQDRDLHRRCPHMLAW